MPNSNSLRPTDCVHRKHLLGFIVMLCAALSLAHAVQAQATKSSSARWLKGIGVAEGTDISKMREEAVAKARVDALGKVGIVIENSAVLVQAENAGKVIDFFSQLSSSKMRGIILEERNKIISDPKPIAGSKSLYQLTAELEALIDVQQGEPDREFEVKLETDRATYIEEQPIYLNVLSTRDGYLTIFHIHNDSLSVIFPNAISKENAITKNVPVKFPPTNVYDLIAENERGEDVALQQFIAVVTKEKIPFPNFEEIKIQNKELLVKQESFSTWAMWLHKIPASQYASDRKAVKVVRKR